MPKTSNLTMFDVNDSGAVVAEIFENPQAHNGKFIATVGQCAAPQEVVDTLSKVAGTYLNISFHISFPTLVFFAFTKLASHEPQGTPINLVEIPTSVFATFNFSGAEELANMFAWFDEFTYFGPGADIEAGKRLVPNLKTFQEWAEKSFKLPSESQ